MGCDISYEVRSSFYDQIYHLEKTKNKIHRKQARICSYLEKFDEITEFCDDTENSEKLLKRSLRKVKNILRDMKTDQRSVSVEIEDSEKSDIKTGYQKNYAPQISEIGLIKSPRGRCSIPKLNPESILEDPEIIAMIINNRNLL